MGVEWDLLKELLAAKDVELEGFRVAEGSLRAPNEIVREDKSGVGNVTGRI